MILSTIGTVSVRNEGGMNSGASCSVVIDNFEIILSSRVMWVELQSLAKILLPFIQLPHLNEERACS